MGIRDLHNNIKCSRGVSPAAAVTDNTAFVSQILDTANFEANEFIGIMGSIADADATFTVLVEDGDDSGLSDAAAVADQFLLGVEAGTVTSGAAASGAAPGFADDNKTFKIGYAGPKRYVRLTLTPAANTGNIFMAGIWVQGGARKLPLSTQVA
jgi:hypothetical protein